MSYHLIIFSQTFLSILCEGWLHQAMVAHVQFCWSGDYVIKATKQSTTSISQEPPLCYSIQLIDLNFSFKHMH